MGFSVTSENKTVEVICFHDEAVQCDQESYQEYLKNLDKEFLELNPEIEPTVFVLSKTLNYDASRQIRNEQVGYNKGQVELRLGHMLDEVRFSLIDIKNPGEGLEFRKDNDGYASKKLIETLEAYGIVQALYTARQSAIGKNQISKKN